MVSPQVLGSDIEYPLRSNALSAKSVLGGRVALTLSIVVLLDRTLMERIIDNPGHLPWGDQEG